MAYSELIKNFEKIRSYMRDFYVYGFKGRDEFDDKSTRMYDDEIRRVKGWLEGYIDSYYDESGKKRVFKPRLKKPSRFQLPPSVKATGHLV